MKALELFADVDEHRRVHFALPEGAVGIASRVRVLVLLPEGDEDEAASFWEQGVAREWAAELADECEDIYSLNDGEPAHVSR
jgi:hypothetical protein